MADLATGAHAAEVPAEERGTLDVRLRAVQHIVERVVLDVPGTVVHTTTLGRVRGSNAPSADVSVRGNHARVSVRVACVWPCDVTAVAERVRDAVRTETPRLAGIELPRVDVDVHVLDPSDTDAPERRRVE